MRTLVIVLFAVGMLLGAGEVAVIAAAKALHATMGGAPLFAVWGAGSFIGGLVVARLGGGARTAAGLAVLLGALTAGHLALIPVDGNVLALGAVLLVAGAAIAPTEATLYAMVGNAAPEGTVTEAFAWLATAMAVGNAAGAAGAGILTDRAGPAAAFALAGGAGALAMLTCMLRSRTIGASTSRGRKPAAPVATGSPATGKADSGRREDCSRLEQVSDAAHRAGQIPDVDSRIAGTVVHRPAEAVPLLLRDRPDADLTHRARELTGSFEAALMGTDTDTDADSA
jgi:MFS family permease